MSTILMSGCYDFFLIKWIAQILGYIMGGLYSFFSIFGIYNIGLCIIVFTFITKLLIFPLSVKQQKWTKVSSVMSPELQAIQKKYANRRDPETMQKQQREMSEVYAKYGTSPTGSCWPMFIQMLILFALYAVIISIPSFVQPISNIFNDLSEKYVEAYDILDDVNDIDTLISGKVDEDFKKYIDNNFDSSKDPSKNKESIYENLVNLYATVEPDKDFKKAYDMAIVKLDSFIALTDANWDEIINAQTDEKKAETLNKYKSYTDEDWNAIKSKLSLLKNNEDEEINSIDEYSNQISDIYTLCKIDLSISPSDAGTWIAYLIPILSFLTQWLSMKISQLGTNQPNMEGNPMASSLKMMTITMPLLSAFFCYTLPSGLGLYWIMSAVAQTLTTIIINRKFKDMDVNDIINENVEKLKKKKEKMGASANDNKISAAASYNAKNIKSNTTNNASEIEYNEDNAENKTYKPGSIAARANMVKQYNEKNAKK